MVTLQAGVELKAREAQERGRARLVPMRTLERVDDGLSLELVQRHGGRRPHRFGWPRWSDLFRRQGNGEVGGGDERAFAGDEGSLDGVLQFADVARPGVSPQQLAASRLSVTSPLPILAASVRMNESARSSTSSPRSRRAGRCTLKTPSR